MPFEFINNNNPIDRTARKLIRSRAALGKNANRTLSRSSRASGVKDTTKTPFHVPTSIRKSRNNEIGIEIGRPAGDSLILPVAVRAESRGLVREALFFFSGIRHTPELDRALDNPDLSTSIWVRYFFMDEAYFHCAVATTILCSRNVVNETTQGMRHITHTFRIVQERLTSKDATSDITIAVLVSMSQYERLRGQHERGYIHVQGLKRMVALRGGIGRLCRECPGVVQKILRADLEYALQLGSRTLFGGESIEVLRTLGGLSIHGGKRVNTRNPLGLDIFLEKSLRADLWILFSDMRSLSLLLSDANSGDRQKLDGNDFHNTIIQFGLRLLQISPLEDTSHSNPCLSTGMSDLESVIHLGLVAYLATFLTGLDRRVPDKPLLSHRLRLSIQRLSRSLEAREDSQAMRSVLVWTLFIGVAAVFKYSDDEWLIPMTRAAMHALGLFGWEDAKKLLGGFPWVNALHGRAGIALTSTQMILA